MGVLHFRYRERRRTLRVALALPVLVHGQNEMGEKFCYRAVTRSVNQQGALLLMDELLVAGQTLLLVNENTNRSTETQDAGRSGIREPGYKLLEDDVSGTRRASHAPPRRQ